MMQEGISRREFLRIGALAAGGIALAGCARPTLVPSETPPREMTKAQATAEIVTEMPVAEVPVELTIWTFGSFFTDYYEEIIPKYKDVAPHVTMKVEEIQYAQMFDNLLAAFAAGTGAPDIADIEQGSMSRFFKGDIGLVNLTDLMQPHSDDYIMVRCDPYSYMGAIYGVDHCLCPGAFFYRWDLFEQAGIEMPVATWDEFIERGATLYDAGVATFSLSDRGWGDFHMLLIQRETGGFFDQDGNVVLDSEEHVNTLRWYVDVIRKGVAAISPPDSSALYALLGEGKIAGQFGADWYGGFLRLNVPDGKGKWKAAPIPAFRPGGPRTTTHGGTGYTITKQCKVPAEAWKFIEFALFDPENKYLEFTINDLLPPIRSMLNDPRYLKPDDWYSGQPIGELYRELADEIPRHYRSPFFNEATIVVGDAVYAAVAEGVDPRDALKEAAERLRDVIAAEQNE